MNEQLVANSRPSVIVRVSLAAAAFTGCLIFTSAVKAEDADPRTNARKMLGELVPKAGSFAYYARQCGIYDSLTPEMLALIDSVSDSPYQNQQLKSLYQEATAGKHVSQLDLPITARIYFRTCTKDGMVQLKKSIDDVTNAIHQVQLAVAPSKKEPPRPSSRDLLDQYIKDFNKCIVRSVRELNDGESDADELTGQIIGLCGAEFDNIVKLQVQNTEPEKRQATRRAILSKRWEAYRSAVQWALAGY